MRQVAELRLSEGNKTAAARLLKLAARVAAATLDKLYVNSGNNTGYFGTLYPNMSLVGVETGVDFIYVTQGLADEIVSRGQMRHQMCKFFEEQLQRPHWMVALSTRDPIARNPVTRRDDHG